MNEAIQNQIRVKVDIEKGISQKKSEIEEQNAKTTKEIEEVLRSQQKELKSVQDEIIKSNQLAI